MFNFLFNKNKRKINQDENIKTLAEIKKDYKGQWIIGDIIKDNDTNDDENMILKVLAHSKFKEKVGEEILKYKNKGLYIYYAYIPDPAVKPKEVFGFM